MSLGPAGAETAAPSPDNLSLLARITGVVFRPRSTFAAVAVRPRWALVLALATAVSFGASAGFLTTEVGQQALVDQWERTALAFGRPIDDAGYREMEELSRRFAIPYAAGSAFVRGPVAVFGIAAVLYGVFAARGARPAFQQALAVVAHANVILALREIVGAPLNYVRESIASPLTLVRLFGMLDEASPVARFFALMDVFMLWWVVVLAIGVSVLYRRRARTVVLGLLGAYVGIAVLLAGAMAVLGGNS